MADEEAPQPQSIAQRIAALKLNQGSPVPSDPPPSYNQATNTNTGRPRPPPPPRPSLPARPSAHGRAASANVPTQNGAAHHSSGQIANLPEQGEDAAPRPALPPRASTQSVKSPTLPPRTPSSASPALPARRPSAAPSADSRRPSNYSLSRRESNESMSSIATTRSGTSAFSNGTSVTSQSERYSIKAPAYDPASLPPLPPKRTAEEKEADWKKYQNVGSAKRGVRPQKSMPKMQSVATGTTPPPPSVPARPAARPPPALPARAATAKEDTQGPPPALPARANTIQPEPVRSPPPPAREAVAPPLRKSALSMGLNQATNTTPPVPGRPTSVPQTDGAEPPPVPTGSRPDLAALKASKPKMNGASTSAAPAQASTAANSCLHCRDFSGPDNHATRFPRQSIPSQDLAWLANQLTSPFPSHTDKARALFTWLHHNIEYDTVAFFNNRVQPSTPQSTLATGLAVCEGYAGLFAALAMKCGLEAYVIGGHGKGYGHSELQPGQPVPAYSAGHAWNVVRIDGGEWKLIDCCWGAGSVDGANRPYQKRFAPERFTQSNDEFGLDHYPEDSSRQFRNDGRIMTWEEYILGNKNGCGADFFAGYVAEEGLDKRTFAPAARKLSIASFPGPTARFSFQKVCPHWDPVRCGKGPQYLYVLALDGLEGTPNNHVPFESNGSVWWCDVPVRDLGRPGGKAQIYVVTEFDGGGGRGVTIERYRQKKGRCAMMFGGVCKWEVVA